MHRKLFIALFTVSILGILTSGAEAEESNSVIPPVAQLTAEWWQWGLESAESPIVDPTGEFCDINQPDGNLWYLAGTFGETAVRTCAIPEERYLFFPLINSIVGLPFPDETVGDLRDAAAEFMAPEIVFELELRIDGKTVVNVLDNDGSTADLFRFRSFSTVFALESFGFPPEEDIWVSDGYWVLVPPLSEGEHVIEFSAVRSAFEHSLFGSIPEFALDVTYLITIIDDEGDDDDDDDD